MLAGLHVVDINIPKTITALALLAGALGVPAWRSARRRRRTALDTKDAAEAARDSVQPTNGAVSLGEEIKERFDDLQREVRLVNQTLEVVVARQHEHGREISQIRDAVRATNGRVRGMETRLQTHLDTVDPLTKWAMEQSGIEIPREGS